MLMKKGRCLAIKILCLASTAPALLAQRTPPARVQSPPVDSARITVALVKRLSSPADRVMVWRQRGRSSQGILVVTPAATGIDVMSAVQSFIESRRAYGDDLPADIRRVVRHDPKPSRFDPAAVVAAQRMLFALPTAPSRTIPGIGRVPVAQITVPANFDR
jgi:hypothetical protein